MCYKQENTKGYDIVIYLSGEWSTFHRQGLITALATSLKGRGQILCVNRPVCPLVSTFKHPDRVMNWIWRRHLEKISDNVFVYTPAVLLHDHLAHPFSGFVKINRLILKKQLSSVLKEIGLHSKRRIAWVYYPIQIDYLGLINETFTVYECYDEYCYTPGGKFKRSVQEEERKLSERINLILTTATSLCESRKKYGLPTYYISNGVDYRHFAKTQECCLEMAPEIEKIPSPRIGYLGNISDRLDFELLREIANRRSDWSLVMIGPVDRSSRVKLLTGLKNVHFLGRVNYTDLPKYLKGLHLALIPFVMNEFTRALNPLKSYEYLASGVPVVSVRLPELGNYQNIIRMAGNDAAFFISAIDDALNGDNTQRIKKGMEVAQKNSWDNVAEKMVEILDKHVKGNCLL